jgi:hypothetical protein
MVVKVAADRNYDICRVIGAAQKDDEQFGVRFRRRPDPASHCHRAERRQRLDQGAATNVTIHEEPPINA